MLRAILFSAVLIFGAGVPINQVCAAQITASTKAEASSSEVATKNAKKTDPEEKPAEDNNPVEDENKVKDETTASSNSDNFSTCSLLQKALIDGLFRGCLACTVQFTINALVIYLIWIPCKNYMNLWGYKCCKGDDLWRHEKTCGGNCYEGMDGCCWYEYPEYNDPLEDDLNLQIAPIDQCCIWGYGCNQQNLSLVAKDVDNRMDSVCYRKDNCCGCACDMRILLVQCWGYCCACCMMDDDGSAVGIWVKRRDDNSHMRFVRGSDGNIYEQWQRTLDVSTLEENALGNRRLKTSAKLVRRWYDQNGKMNYVSKVLVQNGVEVHGDLMTGDDFSGSNLRKKTPNTINASAKKDNQQKEIPEEVKKIQETNEHFVTCGNYCCCSWICCCDCATDDSLPEDDDDEGGYRCCWCCNDGVLDYGCCDDPFWEYYCCWNLKCFCRNGSKHTREEIMADQLKVVGKMEPIEIERDCGKINGEGNECGENGELVAVDGENSDVNGSAAVETIEETPIAMLSPELSVSVYNFKRQWAHVFGQGAEECEETTEKDSKKEEQQNCETTDETKCEKKSALAKKMGDEIWVLTTEPRNWGIAPKKIILTEACDIKTKQITIERKDHGHEFFVTGSIADLQEISSSIQGNAYLGSSGWTVFLNDCGDEFRVLQTKTLFAWLQDFRDLPRITYLNVDEVTKLCENKNGPENSSTTANSTAVSTNINPEAKPCDKYLTENKNGELEIEIDEETIKQELEVTQRRAELKWNKFVESQACGGSCHCYEACGGPSSKDDCISPLCLNPCCFCCGDCCYNAREPTEEEKRMDWAEDILDDVIAKPVSDTDYSDNRNGKAIIHSEARAAGIAPVGQFAKEKQIGDANLNELSQEICHKNSLISDKREITSKPAPAAFFFPPLMRGLNNRGRSYLSKEQIRNDIENISIGDKYIEDMVAVSMGLTRKWREEFALGHRMFNKDVLRLERIVARKWGLNEFPRETNTSGLIDVSAGGDAVDVSDMSTNTKSSMQAVLPTTPALDHTLIAATRISNSLRKFREHKFYEALVDLEKWVKKATEEDEKSYKRHSPQQQYYKRKDFTDPKNADLRRALIERLYFEKHWTENKRNRCECLNTTISALDSVNFGKRHENPVEGENGKPQEIDDNVDEEISHLWSELFYSDLDSPEIVIKSDNGEVLNPSGYPKLDVVFEYLECRFLKLQAKLFKDWVAKQKLIDRKVVDGRVKKTTKEIVIKENVNADEKLEKTDAETEVELESKSEYIVPRRNLAGGNGSRANSCYIQMHHLTNMSSPQFNWQVRQWLVSPCLGLQSDQWSMGHFVHFKHPKDIEYESEKIEIQEERTMPGLVTETTIDQEIIVEADGEPMLESGAPSQQLRGSGNIASIAGIQSTHKKPHHPIKPTRSLDDIIIDLENLDAMQEIIEAGIAEEWRMRKFGYSDNKAKATALALMRFTYKIEQIEKNTKSKISEEDRLEKIIERKKAFFREHSRPYGVPLLQDGFFVIENAYKSMTSAAVLQIWEKEKKERRHFDISAALFGDDNEDDKNSDSDASTDSKPTPQNYLERTDDIFSKNWFQISDDIYVSRRTKSFYSEYINRTFGKAAERIFGPNVGGSSSGGQISTQNTAINSDALSSTDNTESSTITIGNYDETFEAPKGTWYSCWGCGWGCRCCETCDNNEACSYPGEEPCCPECCIECAAGDSICNAGSPHQRACCPNESDCLPHNMNIIHEFFTCCGGLGFLGCTCEGEEELNAQREARALDPEYLDQQRLLSGTCCTCCCLSENNNADSIFNGICSTGTCCATCDDRFEMRSCLHKNFCCCTAQEGCFAQNNLKRPIAKGDYVYVSGLPPTLTVKRVNAIDMDLEQIYSQASDLNYLYTTVTQVSDEKDEFGNPYFVLVHMNSFMTPCCGPDYLYWVPRNYVLGIEDGDTIVALFTTYWKDTFNNPYRNNAIGCFCKASIIYGSLQGLAAFLNWMPVIYWKDELLSVGECGTGKVDPRKYNFYSGLSCFANDPDYELHVLEADAENEGRIVYERLEYWPNVKLDPETKEPLYNCIGSNHDSACVSCCTCCDSCCLKRCTTEHQCCPENDENASKRVGLYGPYADFTDAYKDRKWESLSNTCWIGQQFAGIAFTWLFQFCFTGSVVVAFVQVFCSSFFCFILTPCCGDIKTPMCECLGSCCCGSCGNCWRENYLYDGKDGDWDRLSCGDMCCACMTCNAPRKRVSVGIPDDAKTEE